MLKIEYEIELNESGRPCIGLSEEHYEDKPEDKFLAIELSRYFLQSVYSRKGNVFDKHTSETLDITIRLLGQIADEMSHIIYDGMIAMGEIDMVFEKDYHYIVKTIEERDDIGEFVVTNSKIYKRCKGLKVLVIEDSTTYVLKDGTTNENWEKVVNEL